MSALPRQVHSRVVIGGIFAACVLALAVILWGEDALTGSPTRGGLIVIIVLFATWLLPLGLAALVNMLAVAAPWAALALGDVDPVTARFQFIAILATACLSEVTVRGVVARDRQQRRDTERLRRFAADAAHELRTPLTALRADLETTLRRPRSAEDLTTSLRDALRNTERLIRVSESLMTLARSDAGVLTLHPSEVDMADLIEETWSRWQGHALKANVTLSQKVEGHGSVEVDPILVGRLLDNLVDNAVRHTPAGGQVTLELTPPAEGSVEVAVSDSGPGIPAQLGDSIFERFTRDESPGHSGGAGLGLALCAAIVAAHHGSIQVDRGHVTGTRIAIRLPVAPHWS